MPHSKLLHDPTLAVADLMTRWPATIRVFLRHHMLCVGCLAGAFHTISDACAEHHVDESTFRLDLDIAIRAGLGLTR